MTTSELIEFFKTEDFTKEQGYNLIIADLFEVIPLEKVAQPDMQRLIWYFMYKIQEVLLPAIQEAKKPSIL